MNSGILSPICLMFVLMQAGTVCHGVLLWKGFARGAEGRIFRRPRWPWSGSHWEWSRLCSGSAWRGFAQSSVCWYHSPGDTKRWRHINANTGIKLRGRVGMGGGWFLSVPWARDQCGFPSGARSPCSQTRLEICSRQWSLESIKACYCWCFPSTTNTTSDRAAERGNGWKANSFLAKRKKKKEIRPSRFQVGEPSSSSSSVRLPRLRRRRLRLRRGGCGGWVSAKDIWENMPLYYWRD